MSKRFVDNQTPLNAETLNNFEDDVQSLPIYTAVYEAGSGRFQYKISDDKFEERIKVGYTFIMIPDISSQGTSNDILFIKHGSYGDPLYWNDNDSIPNIGNSNHYARVNNEKYLLAGIPYIVKCFGKDGSNYQFIITEIYRNKLSPATQTILGGVKIWLDGTMLNISTE